MATLRPFIASRAPSMRSSKARISLRTSERYVWSRGRTRSEGWSDGGYMSPRMQCVSIGRPPVSPPGWVEDWSILHLRRSPAVRCYRIDVHRRNADAPAVSMSEWFRPWDRPSSAPRHGTSLRTFLHAYLDIWYILVL